MTSLYFQLLITLEVYILLYIKLLLVDEKQSWLLSQSYYLNLISFLLDPIFNFF